MKKRFNAILRQNNKKLLITVPVFLLLSGCSAQGEDAQGENARGENAQGAGSASSTTAAPAAPSTPEAKTADDQTPKTQTAAPKPDPKYRVVDEANAMMPAQLVAALDKAKVAPPPASMATPKKARVRLLTSKGAITVELNGEAAPLHVKSFLYLSKRGFYDGTVFHRYEPGFVIQGGDPLSKSPENREFAGVGGPGYQVPRERNSLKHEKFVLAAARSQDPNSAGSQFYFTLAPAPFLDEGDGYTVFGKVLDGSANVLKLRAGDKLNKVLIVPAS